MTAAESAEISLVVQGPILAAAKGSEHSTAQFIRASRKFIPKAEIILSTWKGGDVSGIEADRFIFSEDPGPSSRIMQGRLEVCANINRQIVSTREGLRAATRRYCVKLRSDSWLTGTGFWELWHRFTVTDHAYRLFEQRMLVPTAITVQPSRCEGRLFHVSDLFYFGLRTDLVRFWESAPIFRDPDAQTPEDDATRNALRFLTAEQYLFLHTFTQKFPITYHGLQHSTPANAELFSRLLANNFIVAEPPALGVAFVKWRLNPLHTYQLFTGNEWRRLYRTYSDPTHPQPSPIDLWLKSAVAVLLQCRRFFQR